VPIPPTLARRGLLPLEFVLLIALLVVCGVVGLAGLLAAPFDPRRRLLRIAVFAASYVAMEIVVLCLAGVLWGRRVVWRAVGSHGIDDWVRSNQALLANALGWVLHAARRCFNFKVTVSDSSSDDDLVGVDPVLVMARHGGPGDSFALVHLLLTQYERRRVQIVLKEVLQLDPVIDVLLNRLGCCFLPPSTGAGNGLESRVADIARALEPGDALLMFPEGANWTPSRRRRAILHLRQARQDNAARVASLMTNVLPPRPAGVLACLDVRPDLRVVIIAHAGLDKIVRIRQAWELIPLEVPMTVRVWPTAELPFKADDRLAWLTTEWAVVDLWVDAHHNGKVDPS